MDVVFAYRKVFVRAGSVLKQRFIKSIVILLVFVLFSFSGLYPERTSEIFAQSTYPSSRNINSQTVLLPNIRGGEAETPSLEKRNFESIGKFRGNIFVTPNFQVRAADFRLAREVGQQAERYRHELAVRWLGKPLPQWQEKCPINVVINANAQGETSFLLPSSGTGVPTGWDMKIFGPTNRLIDSVLPHEITHTIFATYFGRRLPRWADEGACTTVEHPAEKRKIQTMLLGFLSPQQGKGIPFNHMFRMREYPAEMLPLYAQGYSVARFLIAQGGHRRFVDFLGTGMNNEGAIGALPAWNQAVDRFYGYQDLSDLQLQWLKWVKDGSDEEIAVRYSNNTKLAANGEQGALTNRLAQTQRMGSESRLVSVASNDGIRSNFYVQRMNETTLSGRRKPVWPNEKNSNNSSGSVSKTSSASAVNSIQRIPGRENTAGQRGTSNSGTAQTHRSSSTNHDGIQSTDPRRFARNFSSGTSAKSSLPSGSNNRVDSTIIK